MFAEDNLLGRSKAYNTMFRKLSTDNPRWWSPDPLASLQPWLSPYNSMGSNPINRIDPLGLKDKESSSSSGFGPDVAIPNSVDPTPSGTSPSSSSDPGLTGSVSNEAIQNTIQGEIEFNQGFNDGFSHALNSTMNDLGDFAIDFINQPITTTGDMASDLISFAWSVSTDSDYQMQLMISIIRVSIEYDDIMKNGSEYDQGFLQGTGIEFLLELAVGMAIGKAVTLASSINKAKNTAKAKTFLGGQYGKLPQKKDSGFERHHMPADAASNLSRYKGGAIQIDPADHIYTKSYGASREAKLFRAKQKSLIESGDFKGAFEMDVQDLRSSFGNKYNDAIRQARQYYSNKGIFK